MLPVAAQNDSVSVLSDTLAAEVAALPVIEYTMQRKTYEIADISVSGAESYEDFVLIGFSGLAVGDKIEVPGDEVTYRYFRFSVDIYYDSDTGDITNIELSDGSIVEITDFFA
jgi:hypothetical protein